MTQPPSKTSHPSQAIVGQQEGSAPASSELNTDYGAWIEYLPRGFMTRLNSEVLFVDRAQERVKAMDILRRIAQENNLEGRKAAFVLMCAVDEWALSAPTYFADLAKRSFEGVEEHNSRVNKPQHSKSVDNMRPSPSDSPHRTSHAGHKPAQGPQPSDEPEYNRWLRYFDDTTGRWLDTSVLHTNEGDNWPAAILPWFEKIYTWTGLHDKKAVELLQSIADEFKQQALPRLWEILNNMHTENLSYSWNRNAFFYNHSCVLRQQNPELKIHDDDLGVLQLVPSFKGMGQKDMGPRALKEITRLTGRSGASAVIFLEHVLNHIEMGDDFSTIVERELEREKATCHKFHINNQKRPITTQKKNQKS